MISRSTITCHYTPLPTARARIFCLFAASEVLIAAALFATLALERFRLGDALAHGSERTLLWLHITIEPLCAFALKVRTVTYVKYVTCQLHSRFGRLLHTVDTAVAPSPPPRS